MHVMTNDENICRNASMLLLGDKYPEHIKDFKDAVGEIARAKSMTFREAAAHLADTAMKQGEPPEVTGLFIAAGAELAIAT